MYQDFPLGTSLASPAVFLGDFAVEEARVVAQVPLDASAGATARSMSLVLTTDIPASTNDYWVCQVGMFLTGSFRTLVEFSLGAGIKKNTLRRMSFQKSLSLRPGDVLGITMTPRGQPSPLVGVSVVVDWGSK